MFHQSEFPLYLLIILLCYVSALLPKPSISMNPAAEVTWGQNVGITCSVSTQTQQILSPTFILKKASSSVGETQTSSTNSATFNMPEVNFDNEGSYQCQYKITVAGQDFTSSSDSVSLSVTGKEINQLYIYIYIYI